MGQNDYLGLTPVGGHIRVSDVNVEEGSPKGAGSNTTLYTRVQRRGRSPRALRYRQTSLPDGPGARRLGQPPSELWVKQVQIDQGELEGLATEEQEELTRPRKENKVLRQEREILKKATVFFAREDGTR
jgi:transposase